MIDEESADLVVSTIDLISRKWHPVVVKRLLDAGPLGFSEIEERVPGVSAKVLTDSLADLVEHGLVDRTVVSETPLRVEYGLTDRGRDLRTVIGALEEWGERHLPETPDPLVLVVDDDPRIASMHARWLSDRFRVERAHDGAAAIRAVTDEVDVVLLDRRMPGMSGDEVLAGIRGLDVDVRIVALTAVGVDFDVVDLPVDAYVEKPAHRAALVDAVEEVLIRGGGERASGELPALRSKAALLRGEKIDEELEENEAYARLRARIDRLETDDPTRNTTGGRRAEGSLIDGS